MGRDVPTSIRLDSAALKRIAALVPLLQRTPYGDLGEISRGKVIRLALLRGLDVLEAEVGAKAKGKTK